MSLFPPGMREDCRAHLPCTLADEALIESLPEEVQLALSRILKSNGVHHVDTGEIDAYLAGFGDGAEEVLDQMPWVRPPDAKEVAVRLARLRERARHAA